MGQCSLTPALQNMPPLTPSDLPLLAVKQPEAPGRQRAAATWLAAPAAAQDFLFFRRCVVPRASLRCGPGALADASNWPDASFNACVLGRQGAPSTQAARLHCA